MFRAAAAAPGTVVPLTQAAAGSTLHVREIAVDDALRSDRLASLGLVAGCRIVLRQRRPAYVIDVGETTLALDADIARGIRVAQLG